MFVSSLFTLVLLTTPSFGAPAEKHAIRANSPTLSLTTTFKTNLRNGLNQVLKNDLSRLACLNHRKPESIHAPTTDLLTMVSLFSCFCLQPTH